MKRLVSTCQTGSDTGVNRHAGRGETCKHTHAAFQTGAKQSHAKRGNIHINTRQYAGPSEFTKQFERTRLINGVCVIKRPPPPPPPPSPHLLTCTRPPRTRTRAHRQVWNDTKCILFVMRTNIMYYGPNCFCTLLHAHARAPIKSESGCFILPLNVFPIDHCSKDVINNLKAWLTSTFP